MLHIKRYSKHKKNTQEKLQQLAESILEFGEVQSNNYFNDQTNKYTTDGTMETVMGG